MVTNNGLGRRNYLNSRRKGAKSTVNPVVNEPVDAGSYEVRQTRRLRRANQQMRKRLALRLGSEPQHDVKVGGKLNGRRIFDRAEIHQHRPPLRFVADRAKDAIARV